MTVIAVLDSASIDYVYVALSLSKFLVAADQESSFQGWGACQQMEKSMACGNEMTK